MVLVDSSIWIEAARRDGDLAAKVALEALLEEFEAALTSPVRLEVLGGARREDRKSLENYFEILPYFSVLEEDWRNAVRNTWQLLEAGWTVPWNDIIVATLALRLNVRVYAKDAHFDSMRTVLGLRLYEPGPGGRFAPMNAPN